MSLRPTHYEPANGTSVGTALVMTTNNRLSGRLILAFKEINVATVSTSLARDSIELIHGRKFEAFVLDTALDTPFLDLLSEIRSSPSNSMAVIMAIAPPGPICDLARQEGANFILEQPLTFNTILRTLKAAYGMLVREYRRYFRCPIKLPITVWSSLTAEVQGETVDISEDGMAIRLSYSLGVDTDLVIRIKLSAQSEELTTRAKIIRTAEGGVVGIRFVEISSFAKAQLHEWLSLRLEEKYPTLAKHTA
jgi:hypothetical protein